MQLAVWASDRPTFSVYLENDLMMGTDRYYTGGLKFSWLSADISSYELSQRQDALADRMPFLYDDNSLHNIGLSIGQQIYTPQNIHENALIESDRPYAGWSYFAYSFVSRSREVMHTLETRIGMVGPASGAEMLQNGLHRLLGNDEVKGWDNQLGNEVGINVYYERRRRLEKFYFSNSVALEAIPYVGAALGNIRTQVATGGIVRLGCHLPEDFGPSLIAMSAEPSAPLDGVSSRQYSGYFFVGIGINLVGIDLFLDGNTFKESHRVEKNPLVTAVGIGYSQQIGSWRLAYAQILSSKEFKGQPEPSWFGSLMVSRTF